MNREALENHNPILPSHDPPIPLDQDSGSLDEEPSSSDCIETYNQRESPPRKKRKKDHAALYDELFASSSEDQLMDSIEEKLLSELLAAPIETESTLSTLSSTFAGQEQNDHMELDDFDDGEIVGGRKPEIVENQPPPQQQNPKKNKRNFFRFLSDTASDVMSWWNSGSPNAT